MELGFPIRQRPGPLQSVSLTSNEVWEVGPVSPSPIQVWEDNPSDPNTNNVNPN